MLRYIQALESFSIVSVVVIVGVLTSCAVDNDFEPQSGHTKDYEIGMCCFSVRHAV